MKTLETMDILKESDKGIVDKLIDHVISALNRIEKRLDRWEGLIDPVMTTQEAANYLKVKNTTIQYYVSRGKLKAKKIGKGFKFLKSELDRFLS